MAENEGGNGRWDMIYRMLQDLTTEVKEMRTDTVELKIRMAEAKGRSGIWGMLGGVLSALLTILIGLAVSLYRK